MHLAELLLGFADVQAETDVEITQISLDSREIIQGGVFFAVAGAEQHGLCFAKQVQQQGALAIVYDPAKQGEQLAQSITGIALYAVEELASKLAEIAAKFYAYSAIPLKLIGITGTNGKTSCSQFLAQALEHTALIGTLGWGCYASLHNTLNTTPDAFNLHKILAQFVQQGIENVAMEVSSHGLQQGRVNSLSFQGVVFNNLSRDHLDYHGNMEAYFQVKLRLMQWPALQFVVLNLDDDYAGRVLQAVAEDVTVVTYSLQNKIDSRAESLNASNVQYSMAGICCDVSWQGEQVSLSLPLLGDFNLQNSLAVIAVMLLMGKSLTECCHAMNSIKAVIGRMECFQGSVGKPLLVVDYAHTPDALKQVLSTLRRHCENNLSVVFGCGGDRDKGKRQEMGRIAAELADTVIVTDDNPRFEEPTDIIDDIIAGLMTDSLNVINDRKSAIEYAIKHAAEQDIVLIAGKGHEDYQDLKGVKQPFSDREIVQELLV
ncbi:MAG: UDP-N-acetylmuramoyl-L-alanyl-D-glutamate--2,6-diaminopimelate ligase [Methyloprofundus sp.]|nr:UDP-N-acetylmuramoyl-L-alanyl-D-glutamate--2,6-diaminopimelate ligase [Methyloprofundus sp.]